MGGPHPQERAMDLDLSGKLALVTGSTMGIGHATALGLARMGAGVVVNGRSEASVAQAIDRIRRAVPKAELRAAPVDLSNAEGCAELIRQVPAVDILVNNMGIYEPRPFFDIADADWQRMFEVNVMSGVRLTRHYLKGMLDADKWGRVVFVSSESAIFVPKEMVHYGFSKSAQLIVARGAAELTKGTKVTVNSVLPGPTWVEMQPTRLAARAKSVGTTADELARRTFTERRPASLLQRYASPEEIANLVCYLCSKASSATNGAALRADGGIVTNPF
jgi:NAD(P)-dependent dehydrogenase (short-subunit alcohol dehydrogenase family)